MLEWPSNRHAAPAMRYCPQQLHDGPVRIISDPGCAGSAERVHDRHRAVRRRGAAIMSQILRNDSFGVTADCCTISGVAAYVLHYV